MDGARRAARGHFSERRAHGRRNPAVLKHAPKVPPCFNTAGFRRPWPPRAGDRPRIASPVGRSNSSSIYQIPNTEHMAYRLVRTLVYKRGVGIRWTVFGLYLGIWVAPMEIRPPGCLASCGRRKCGSARCSGDAFIAPTASQTDGRNLPPEQLRRESDSNPRPPNIRSGALHVPAKLAGRASKAY